MPTSEEAAVTAAQAAVVEGEPEAPSGSDEQTIEAVEAPSFEVELPAELRALLEEPEIEDVKEDDIEALAQQYEDADTDLLQRLAAAEKRAKHFEDLRAAEARKGWTEEARKYFPLAEPFLEEINATSKRGFLRTAKDVHDRLLPKWNEAVTKQREVIEQNKEKEIEETKEEVKAAWGAPVKEDQTNTPPPVAQREQQRRRRGELSDTIRSMMFPS